MAVSRNETITYRRREKEAREREREEGRRKEGEGGREVYRYIVIYHIKTFGSMTDDIRNGCPIRL